MNNEDNRKLNNPLIYADFPDPDVIRVDDAYYMISTTMYYYPGGVILRSYDLLNWEIAGRVFNELADLPCEHLIGDAHAYGRGMWAGSLRYHEGLFYVFFTAFETGNSFIFTSKTIEGPWEKHVIEGKYHDASMLFDDGHIYLVFGNGTIHLKELNKTLDGFVEEFGEKIIFEEDEEVFLPCEGSHFYKINGHYYLFMIHWVKKQPQRRVEICCISDSLEGPYKKHEVFNNDIGFFGQGVAQGGIFDTPDGQWFAMLFQDRGALGRVPVLVPMTWDKEVPVLSDPREAVINVPSGKPDYRYDTLWSSDFFGKQGSGDKTLKKCWEWNHMPDYSNWYRTDDDLVIRNNKICSNITQTSNMLTQRMMGPKCSASVCVDGSNLKDGDFAGLAAFIAGYAWIGISKEIGRYFLVVYSKDPKYKSRRGETQDYLPSKEEMRIPLDGNVAEFKIVGDYTDMKDTVELYYRRNNRWIKAYEQKMVFELETFVGCRFGLFNFATRRVGGEVTFFDFAYNCLPNEER